MVNLVPDGMNSHLKALCHLFASSAGFLFFVVTGTVFYALVEPCSCSYGTTHVSGCVDEYCDTTGGYQKTWVDSYYMAVITLTTVGFGDHSPRSWYGRLFGIFYMIFGVLVTASFVATSAEAFFEAKTATNRRKAKEISMEVFAEIDKGKKGYFTRVEFMEYLLLKHNLVSKSDIDVINEQFDEIDTDGNGQATYEEIRARYTYDTVESFQGPRKESADSS